MAKKSRKSDLAIETIFVLFLAVISIALVIAFFSGSMGELSKKAYCHAVYPVQSRLFTSQQTNPECEKEFSFVTVRANCSALPEEIIAHSVACWDMASFGRRNKDLACYELVIPAGCIPEKSISEQDLTQILVENNLCHILSNNKIGDSDVSDADEEEACGTEDNLLLAKEINTQTNVFIEYKAKTKKIVVS